MFGLGFTELLLLLLIAFLVLGPQQLPGAAKNFIKLLNELKRAWAGAQAELKIAKTEAEKQIQQIEEEALKSLTLDENLKKKEAQSDEK